MALMLYGSLLTITPAAVEPVSLADVKEWLRVEAAITADDNLCNALLRASRKAIEKKIRRALMTTTFDLVLDDPLPVEPFEMPVPPLQSVTGIYFTNTADVEGAAVTASKYIVDNLDTSRPARIILKESQSWGDTSLRKYMGTRIRFVAGYGAVAASGATAGSVPEDLVLAIKRTILTNFEFREDLLAGTIVAQIPADASKLLAPFKVDRV